MESVETRQYNGHQLATVLHDTYVKKVVIFCHGFRGSMIGPSRLFVTAARQLAENKISSLRFDQYGSGNSEGNFLDSSFTDWVNTTEAIVKDFLNQGYTVALFGQSMGAATVINVASEISDVVAGVAWVPDPNVETFRDMGSLYVEEGGQRVQSAYWQEAHDADIAKKLRAVGAPLYIVQCSEDEYVSENNHASIQSNAQSKHTVEMFEGLKHSAWTYDQAEKIVQKSVEFLIREFEALPNIPTRD